MSLRLVLPLSKAFSDSARAAALAARRAKMKGDAGSQESLMSGEEALGVLQRVRRGEVYPEPKVVGTLKTILSGGVKDPLATEYAARLLSEVKTEKGQHTVVDAMLKAAKDNPEVFSGVGNYTLMKFIQSAVDTQGILTFRGPELDRLMGDSTFAGLVRKHRMQSVVSLGEEAPLLMFSPDYKEAMKTWANEFVYGGLSRAHLKAFPILEKVGPNKGKKFWTGDQPLGEGNLTPSKNLTDHLSELYAETQEFYRKKLATREDPNPDTSKLYVDVYRGVRGVYGGEKVYTPGPVESWTSDRGAADYFASKRAEKNSDYSILHAKVPISSILMSHETLSGGEMETHSAGEVGALAEIDVLGGALTDIDVTKKHRGSGGVSSKAITEVSKKIKAEASKKLWRAPKEGESGI